VTEGALSGEETATGETETTTVEVSEVATAVPEKCIPQFVLTVVLRPRFHSSQLREDRFTAETAYQTTGSSKSRNSRIFDFNHITGNLPVTGVSKLLLFLCIIYHA